MTKYITLLSGALFLASCSNLTNGVVKEIELPPHDPQIAASLFIDSRDSSFSATISESRGLFDTTKTGILQGATVNLYQDGNLWHTWDEMDPFLNYTKELGQLVGTPTGVLTFEVEHPDYETVHATQRFPSPTDFDLDISYGTTTAYGSPSDELTIVFKDNPGENQHYLVEMAIHARTTLTGEDTSVYYQLYPEFTNPNASYVGEAIAISEEGIDRDVTFRLATGFNSIDALFLYEYRVTVRTLSDDLYTFYNSYQALQMSQGNPFAEPVILFSNMSNSMGSFGVSTTTRKWE